MLKPSIFPSVPRLYNRIYGKIKATFETKTGCARWLINKGLAAKTQGLNNTGAVKNGCWDKLVFKKTAALLGGNVRLMITGSAPIDKDVLDFLKICFCCPFLEGYGLTESSGGACITNMRDPLVGHVGGPTEYVKFRLKDLPEMDYRITDQPFPRGEVCMYGPLMFDGYYKRPDKTAECHDNEGWFMTGDVAMVYPNGSLKIIDRSKNIFKLS
jgi:long-chain acyl-CoA synthetase